MVNVSRGRWKHRPRFYYVARDRTATRGSGNSPATFDYPEFFPSLDLRFSPPKGGASNLKCGREQQHRAQWDKQDGNAGIVFEMPQTGKKKAGR
jgi:hypothetical protein